VCKSPENLGEVNGLMVAGVKMHRKDMAEGLAAGFSLTTGPHYLKNRQNPTFVPNQF
jgi:hypothetical protein